MKKGLHVLVAVFFTSQLFAQNFTGQWKGQFSDKSTSFIGWGGNRCDYVLEIECSGKNASGYSYTYFNEGGKRYYTICRLKGTINTANKSIEVVEVERTKTNVPNNIRNCFQIHRLAYNQQGDDQILEGTWVPAPKQEGDCGYGSTTLTRRVLKTNNALYNNTTVITEKKTDPNKTRNTTPPVVKVTPKITTPPLVVKEKPVTVDKVQNNTDIGKNNDNRITENPTFRNKDNTQRSDINFEKRNNTLIKTIEIENEKFKVDLYDNGEIDGDSISLFFNGKLLLAHRRLSDKALSLELSVDESKDMNELIMYAENLGSIPPNTALMVVTDGDNRYEVRIASDLQKSGSIRFIHKPKKEQ